LPVAFLELLGRFFSLLDQRGHNPAHSGIVEVLLQLDFLVLHGGLNHADHVHA
jgi:hypothetical protein